MVQMARPAKTKRLRYVWIIRCCIDKTSSAELSKAINCMFQWYWDSVACVAFLSDMVREEMGYLPKDDGLWERQFARSRWVWCS
ncbi:hypothetical protein CDEST_04726 [Colletotrichum destructivum]|uniref:Heterokaryon incompatibility domain-containing protein n=1 Tax=Colletotrichum destructivum TaxID=34406 RepID=A0AAX4I929_9PEZI|nr:hypothetical protein CDEST_04726 [Colletotrichum destructivum]